MWKLVYFMAVLIGFQTEHAWMKKNVPICKCGRGNKIAENSSITASFGALLLTLTLGFLKLWPLFLNRGPKITLKEDIFELLKVYIKETDIYDYVPLKIRKKILILKF